MSELLGHYINGHIVTNSDGVCQAIFNPAMGEAVRKVVFADALMVEQAVVSAQAAFSAWAETPVSRRVNILFKFRQLLEQHIEEIAALVTEEHGKTLADARASIMRGIEIVEVSCGIAHQLQGTFSANVSRQVDCYTLRQPLGVCVGVSPFNFPVMIPLWLVVPAIACGNTMVLKPSEVNPSAPLRLAELLTEAGLPPGVLNILQGGKAVVDVLLQHQNVRAVTAIGSTPVAESIYKTAIANGKRAHTFGGAKNHAVVLADADIESTANAIVGAAYGSAGERCMAISAVICVGDPVADRLIAVLKENISSLRIGSGKDPNVEMGPLLSKAHLQRVQSYIDQGIEEGAELMVDGRGLPLAKSSSGFYLGASLFDHVSPQMRIYQEEIFGPVLVMVRVKDFAAALDLVNQHQYGNGTAIFTRSGHAARTFASQVQVGMVGINVSTPVPVAYHSFGGWKRSFFGDIHLHGDQNIQFYTKLKTVTARWFGDETSRSDFTLPTTGA